MAMVASLCDSRNNSGLRTERRGVRGWLPAGLSFLAARRRWWSKGLGLLLGPRSAKCCQLSASLYIYRLSHVRPPAPSTLICLLSCPLLCFSASPGAHIYLHAGGRCNLASAVCLVFLVSKPQLSINPKPMQMHSLKMQNPRPALSICSSPINEWCQWKSGPAAGRTCGQVAIHAKLKPMAETGLTL